MNEPRLLIEHRVSGHWYKRKGDTREEGWQFGGNTRSEAVRQAYDRCFINLDEVVEDTHTGTCWTTRQILIGTP